MNLNQRSQSREDNARIATVIGKGSKVVANCQIEGRIRVEGDLKGQVTSNGVVIGASGEVEADIKTGEATIDGKLVGNMEATDSIRLGKNSVVIGEIKSSRLFVEEGAVLKGNCDIGGAVAEGHRSET